MKNTCKRIKKGFTLVELVVVIAVIAILASVAVGAYFGIVENGKDSSDRQFITQANKLLVIDETLKNEFHQYDLKETLELFEENGLINDTSLDRYNVKDSNVFYLDTSINRLLITDKVEDINNAKAIYPEEYFDRTLADVGKNGKWILFKGIKYFNPIGQDTKRVVDNSGSVKFTKDISVDDTTNPGEDRLSIDFEGKYVDLMQKTITINNPTLKEVYIKNGIVRNGTINITLDYTLSNLYFENIDLQGDIKLNINNVLSLNIDSNSVISSTINGVDIANVYNNGTIVQLESKRIHDEFNLYNNGSVGTFVVVQNGSDGTIQAINNLNGTKPNYIFENGHYTASGTVGEDSNGDGTQGNPYLIHNQTTLNDFFTNCYNKNTSKVFAKIIRSFKLENPEALDSSNSGNDEKWYCMNLDGAINNLASYTISNVKQLAYYINSSKLSNINFVLNDSSERLIYKAIGTTDLYNIDLFGHITQDNGVDYQRRGYIAYARNNTQTLVDANVNKDTPANINFIGCDTYVNYGTSESSLTDEVCLYSSSNKSNISNLKFENCLIFSDIYTTKAVSIFTTDEKLGSQDTDNDIKDPIINNVTLLSEIKTPEKISVTKGIELTSFNNEGFINKSTIIK